MTLTRQAEIAANLDRVETQIAQACEAAGRARDEVTLIAVTKTYPASDAEILAELGVADVGENWHPEAERKKSETRADLRWHFLGGLQTNKAAAVAKYADMVHSVDRPKLVRALNQGAESAGRILDCLVQVDLDTTDPGRAGVEPDKALELADLVSQSDHLHLAGLMVVAPLGVDPEPVFAQLATLSKQLQELHPSASVVSAGMSQDFATAIKYGTTHVRIGRSILGNR